jgi:hypothetical protein
VFCLARILRTAAANLPLNAERRIKKISSQPFKNEIFLKLSACSVVLKNLIQALNV